MSCDNLAPIRRQCLILPKGGWHLCRHRQLQSIMRVLLRYNIWHKRLALAHMFHVYLCRIYVYNMHSFTESYILWIYEFSYHGGSFATFLVSSKLCDNQARFNIRYSVLSSDLVSHRFEIWQASRQQLFRGACQIPKRSNKSEYTFRCIETLREFTIRRIREYWNRAL